MTTEKKALTCKEVCTIIEKCDSHGVTSFELGELKFSFETKAETIIETPKPLQISIGPEAEVPQELLDEQDRQAGFAMKEAELIQKENDLSTMHIEDPAEYERLVANGTIEEMEKSLGDDYAELERSRA